MCGELFLSKPYVAVDDAIKYLFTLKINKKSKHKQNSSITDKQTDKQTHRKAKIEAAHFRAFEVPHFSP